MALVNDREFRNSTAPWFARYTDRLMFRKLGYTSPLSEIRQDECEWFEAIEAALGRAQAAKRKTEAMKRGR